MSKNNNIGSVGNGLGDYERGTSMITTFKFSDSGYDIDKLNAEQKNTLITFLRSKKSIVPFEESTTYLDNLKAQAENASQTQILDTDLLQSLFNDIRLEVKESGVLTDLNESLQQSRHYDANGNKIVYPYYDFEKQKYFIDDADSDMVLPRLMTADYEKIKYIFDNIINASVESVQIQFLKKIQVAVEKLSNDNEEYILGLIFSYITLGAGVPFLPNEIIKSIKTQLATIDSELQKECSQVIQEGLYLQYDFNEMLTKDSDFAKAYANEVWNGAYNIDTHNFEKNAGDTIGSFEDPFAILGVLNTGTMDKPLYEDFLAYLADAQKNFFVTGIDAVNVANYLAEKTDKMPVVNVGNLIIEVPILKNYNLKYKFTRYSFFLFLQTLHSAFINKQKRYVKESLQAILSGNKKIGTLSNSDEEKQAQTILGNYEAGQINFQRISNPEYVFGNNQVYMLLQMGDVLIENKQSISLNVYLRLIYLLKEKYANFINEFEYDHLFVVTLANDKRVDTLPSSYEEGVAQQYAETASKEPAYLKALDNYIWVEDELTSIGDKPITLSVYNRTMTLLKENYGIQTPTPIVNPASIATKPDNQVSDAEKTKKNQESLLRTGLLTLFGYIIFK